MEAARFESLGRDLWVATRPFRLLGCVEFGVRMTVIDVGDGRLLLYSPVALDDATHRALDEIGRVELVLAPSPFHHLWIGEYARAYPRAELFAAPGVAEKHRDVRFAAEIGETAPDSWPSVLQYVLFRPVFNEVVVFHPPSRSLLVCDLAFNLPACGSLASRLFHRANGVGGRFAASRLTRMLMREPDAARNALERILGWDFERVIVAHGSVLESGGRDALRNAYAWL